MNSMALSSMTQTYSSLDDGSDVVFVNLDSRYTCANCHKWLRRPLQTECGHRICQLCYDKWFNNESNHGRGFPCPANEDGCVVITRDKVYPDHSAAREIRQQKVFCTYKKYGCNETPALGKLKEHVAECKYVKSCPYCKDRIPPDLLDNHIKDQCPNAPVTCEYCKKCDLQQKEMIDHYKECPLKPQPCKYSIMGCLVQLPSDKLLRHENDAGEHLEMFAEHVSKLELENTRLLARVQNALTELEVSKDQLLRYAKENEELKRHTAELQESLRRSEERHLQVVAVQNEKIMLLQTQIQTVEDKTQEIGQLKTKCTQLEHLISEAGASAHQSREVSLPEDVRKKFIAHDRMIGLHDVRLSEVDLRLQCTETANYDGVLIWKIGEYRERKRQAVEGRILSLYSQPFYTSRYGYKMCARVYLNGDGVGRGTHMSLFFVVMQGDYDEILAWPFRQKVTLTLIDHLHNRRHLSDTFRPDPTSSSFQKPTTAMNVASGCPLFVPHAILEATDGLYLRNNTIFIKVVVDTTDLLNP